MIAFMGDYEIEFCRLSDYVKIILDTNPGLE